MNRQKLTEERVEKVYEIIAAIDHWLKVWNSGNVDVKVGVVIQRHAMRELAFLDMINRNWLTMDTLREKANTELKRLGQPIVLETLDSSWSIPFTLTPKKTRRKELEDMDWGDIAKLHRDARMREKEKEQEARKKKLRKSRIDYILESEKEYK